MSLNGFKPSNQNLNNLKPNSDFCEDSLEIKGPVGSVDKQTKNVLLPAVNAHHIKNRRKIIFLAKFTVHRKQYKDRTIEDKIVCYQ